MGRRTRSASRAVLLAGALLIAAACGARTGLDYDLPDGPGTANSEGGSPIDGGSKDGSDNVVGCQDGHFTLRRASPAVMFILDRSQSMRERLASGDTRWTTLTESLAATLPPVDNSMEIGALIYPVSTGTSQSCVVPSSVDVLPAFGNVDTITNLLRRNGPRGSTPTADAVSRAASALLGVRAATRARAMVLATDGEPTCNTALDGKTCSCVDGRCATHPEGCLDDKRTEDRLAAYRDQGLPTYVIGIQDLDNVDLVDVLDRLAIAGGRPQNTGARRYYAASSQAELDLAISTIRDQVGSCTYLTTSVPGANGTIVVSIDGKPVGEGPDWEWSNRANGEILFTTGACSNATGADLTVDVQCNPTSFPGSDSGAPRDAGRPIFDASIRD